MALNTTHIKIDKNSKFDIIPKPNEGVVQTVEILRDVVFEGDVYSGEIIIYPNATIKGNLIGIETVIVKGNYNEINGIIIAKEVIVKGSVSVKGIIANNIFIESNDAILNVNFIITSNSELIIPSQSTVKDFISCTGNIKIGSGCQIGADKPTDGIYSKNTVEFEGNVVVKGRVVSKKLKYKNGNNIINSVFVEEKIKVDEEKIKINTLFALSDTDLSHIESIEYVFTHGKLTLPKQRFPISKGLFCSQKLKIPNDKKMEFIIAKEIINNKNLSANFILTEKIKNLGNIESSFLIIGLKDNSVLQINENNKINADYIIINGKLEGRGDLNCKVVEVKKDVLLEGTINTNYIGCGGKIKVDKLNIQAQKFLIFNSKTDLSRVFYKDNAIPDENIFWLKDKNLFIDICIKKSFYSSLKSILNKKFDVLKE